LLGLPSKMDIVIELIHRKRRPSIKNCKALLS
jgi:hypothetical protein